MYVQNEEVELENKRKHCESTAASLSESRLTPVDIQVVKAFESALQLLQAHVFRG